MSTFNVSLRGVLGGLALAAGFVVAAPSSSYGAAAAAKGVTSISVSSVDAALNEITLAFDPRCMGGQPGGATSYNIDAFQLAVQYNAADLTLVSTTYAPPFTALPLDCGTTQTTGVSQVAGIACPDDTTPGDVNLFYETFKLKAGVSQCTALTFTFGATSDNDYLYAVDTAHPDDARDAVTYIGPSQIQSSTLTTSICGSTVPLPPASAAGGMTLLLALGGAGLRARNKSRAA